VVFAQRRKRHENMKRFLIFISIIVLLIAFYAIVSMLRSSALEKQRQQEAIRLENNYQEGIKQISEGKFGDAMTSLSHAALSNYKHARLLYFYAKAEETGDLFYIEDEVPKGYNGPLAQEILALKDKAQRIRTEKIKTGKVRKGRDEVEKAIAESDRLMGLVKKQTKEEQYLEELESILKDVRYSTSAADSYRAEQKLRALREQYMNDPNITAKELKKLDQAIDAVRAMRR
jgi:cbb3-type cytochrome oxidase subunit 3